MYSYPVAGRDIKDGEELTTNYKDFDEDSKKIKGDLYDKRKQKITNKNGTSQSKS